MRPMAFCFAAAALAAAASGCSSTSEPTTSVVTGTIAQSSFSAPVRQITVVNSAGTVSKSAVDASGAFTLTLAAGSSYHFLLSADGKNTPIVLRDNAGQLETEVSVTSGGATVDLGSVRFWGGSPATANALMVSTTPTTPSTGACLGGVVQGTAKPCSTGVAASSCASHMCMGMGMHGGGHGEHGEHGEHDGEDGPGNEGQQGEQGEQGQQGEQDTADATSTKSATVTTLAAVGIPLHSLAATLGCGGGERHHEHDEGDDD